MSINEIIKGLVTDFPAPAKTSQSAGHKQEALRSTLQKCRCYYVELNGERG